VETASAQKVYTMLRISGVAVLGWGPMGKGGGVRTGGQVEEAEGCWSSMERCDSAFLAVHYLGDVHGSWYLESG
jgi:hypothetical protein